MLSPQLLSDTESKTDGGVWWILSFSVFSVNITDMENIHKR